MRTECLCRPLPSDGIPLTRKQFVNGFVATLGGLFLPANAFGTGTPIMKFGLVSDVHLGGEGKDADLEKVLRFFDAQGVDVFADHLVLHRRSVMFDEPLGEDWAVPLPAAQGNGFDFKVRRSRMIAPEFAPGAKVTVTYCPKGHPEQAKRYAGEPCVAVDFPPASTPRGMVCEYEVAARFEGGPEIVRAKVIPNGFGLAKSRMNIPGTCLFRTCELAGERPIVFSVTAGECFGKKGRPIESVPFSY